MPLPKLHTYTIDDIYDLPEGHRAELIDGQIYDMAPPSTAHQRILSFLHLEIASYIRTTTALVRSFRHRLQYFSMMQMNPIYPTIWSLISA